MRVSYKDGEIIELFSPYLMDLDNKIEIAFYFVYEYKFIKNKFINLLKKQFNKMQRDIRSFANCYRRQRTANCREENSGIS